MHASARGSVYLTVVNREIEMVERVVRGTVDDVFKWMTGNHVGVMDLIDNVRIGQGCE